MIWNASRIVSPLHLPSHSLMKSFVKDLLVLIPVVGTLLVLHKSKSIITSLGLDSSILKGLAYSFVFTLPLCFGFAIFGKYNSEITLSVIVRQCVLAALFEEIVFRGFMFGQLFRYSKVGFFWAAFFPAILGWDISIKDTILYLLWLHLVSPLLVHYISVGYMLNGISIYGCLSVCIFS